MEEVKRGSLKTQFFAAVAVTLVLVTVLSALTVWGCLRFQRWLVPDTNYVMLNMEMTTTGGEIKRGSMRCEIDGGSQRYNFIKEKKNGVLLAGAYDIEDMAFRVESVEYGIGTNGPRRKAAYITAGAAMGILPAVYALAGTVLCALWFYRKRLAPAISVLDDATRHISEQDLDFTVECPVHNELGRLCGSFEKMRRALCDNNRKLWRTMEERRTMQASVAHDLRNPLAIMEGTVEHIRALAPTGELTGDKLDAALETVAVTAKRMERYTDYIRDLAALEDTEITTTEAALPDFLREAAEGVRVLAEPKNLTVSVSYDVPEGVIELDREIFYRVLENVFSNAVRYAQSRIELAFELRGETLFAKITDDGPGFSPEMLKKKSSLYYSEDASGEHMGLGLATGKILCGLHGGGLRIMNRPEGGAVVEITVAVKRI